MAYRNWAQPSYGSYQNAVDGAIDVSRFNGSQLINIRIQNYWAGCGTAFKNGDFETVRDILNILWTEFYADSTEKQKQFIIDVDKKIADAIIMRNHHKKNGKYAYYNLCYQRAIYDKWLFLKTLEKVQGVGKAYVDKTEDDWD